MTDFLNRTARRLASALIMAFLALAGYTTIGFAQTKPAGKAKVGAKPRPSSSSNAARSESGARSQAEAPKWPVDSPAPLPGAILPAKRIVAFYGNPLSKRM